jgi:hypothetical protein
MTDAARVARPRARHRIAAAATAAVLFAAAGCHRLNRHDDAPAARRAPDSPLPAATRPAAPAVALLDASAIRERAEREEVPELANVLRLIPHTAGLGRFHHIADPLLAGAKRVVVLQYVGIHGGSAEWEEPPSAADAGSRAAASRVTPEQADNWVRVWTLVLYEDAHGIGYITDFAKPPLDEQAEAERRAGTGNDAPDVAPLRPGEAGVSSGYWTAPVQPDPEEVQFGPGAREWAEGRARLQALVGGTKGVEVLRGGDSWDGAEALVFSVTDGTRFGAVAGVNVGHWIDVTSDRPGPVAPRALDAVRLWHSIERHARATDP